MRTVPSLGGGDGSSGSGGATSCIYTNLNKSTVAVGNVPKGSFFNNQTMQQMFDAIFYGTTEEYPTLTAPSCDFVTDLEDIVEVNTKVYGTFTTSFNRGKIEPPYGTSGYRSGLANKYNYTGEGLQTSITSSNNSHSQSLKDYIFTTPGSKKWTASVSYDKGEQPLSSEGNPFNTALLAGTTGIKTIEIYAVYAVYANTEDPDIQTKQPLSNPEEYYELTLVGEQIDSAKQSIEWQTSVGTLKGVQMFSSITNSWEWMRGSKEKSLETWTESEITKNELSYYRYVNNVSRVGSRQLRFYFK